MPVQRLQTAVAHLTGTSNASRAAFCCVFLLALSLPPKWATLHVAGAVLVAMTAFARREDWRSPAAGTFLLCTMLWLVPVLLAAVLQHLLGMATAPAWHKLPLLVLRTLGIGLGIIVLLQRNRLTLASIAFAVACALAIHAIAGLSEFLVSPDASLTNWRALRISGMVFNPNPFGLFMAIAVILAAGLLRGDPRRLAVWMLLAAGLLGVWASGSRNALLATACGLAAAFPPVDRRRLIAYAVSFAAALLAYLNLVPADGNIAESNTMRLQIIAFTLDQIRQSPWLGWGIGAYQQLPGHVLNAPHNMWLDLAVSSGLLAPGGALASTALLAHRLYRRGSAASLLALGALTASVVAGSLEYSILDSTHFRGLWILVTALACCTLNPATPSTNAARAAASRKNQRGPREGGAKKT
jgi:O-antigen ligase